MCDDANLSEPPPGPREPGRLGLGSYTVSAFARSAPRPSGVLGKVLALVAAGAQIVAMFQPWTADGITALDLGLLSLGTETRQPTVAVALIVLAAVAAIPTLVGDAGWPRLVSGVGSGGLVLSWIGFGPDGQLTAGVVMALGGAVGHIVAAAFATRAGEQGPTPERERWDVRWGGGNASPLKATSDGSGPQPAPNPQDPRPAPDRDEPRPASDPNGPRPLSDSSGLDPPHESGRKQLGHRLVSHTADVIIEAWGPSRATCYSEALQALVSSFAETTEVAGSEGYETVLEASDDEDLLVDLLDEVIYLLDARGVVPVGGDIRDRDDGGIDVRFDLADVGVVRPSGAVPKATTYHELEVAHREDGWFCRATIDV